MKYYLIVSIVSVSLFLLILGVVAWFEYKRRFIKNFNYYELQFPQGVDFNLFQSKTLFEDLYRTLKDQSKFKFKSQIGLILEANYKKSRYVLACHDELSSDLIEIIQSQSEALTIVKTDFKFIPRPSHRNKVFRTNLVLRKHYAYPLDLSSNFDSTKLFLNCRQLEVNEQFNLNIFMKPNWGWRQIILRNRILRGYKLLATYQTWWGKILSLIYQILYLGGYLIKQLLFLFENLINLSNKNARYQMHPNLQISTSREKLILNKLYSPLFTTTIRVTLSSEYNYRLKLRIATLKNSIANFRGPYKQRLILSKKITKVYLNYFPNLVAIPFEPKAILSSTELANFFTMQDTPVYRKFFSFEVNSKLRLSSNQKNQLALRQNEVLLGVAKDQNKNIKVGLSQEERIQHSYICGSTGSGKSTLIAEMALQDLRHKRAITLIDPHGDLAHYVVNNLQPKDKMNLTYLAPSTLSQLKINILELNLKRSDPNYDEAKNILVDTITGLFGELFNSNLKLGHRIEYLLRNTILTAMDIPNSNIFTVFSFLNNKKFRQATIPLIKDNKLKQYWLEEFEQAGDYQRVKMISGVSSKIGKLLFNKTLKAIFDTTQSNLDFDDIIKNKKSIIANLSQAELGKEGSDLIANVLTFKIAFAAQLQAKLDLSKRVYHYLYLDEFQNLNTSYVANLLSLARKYRLGITLAEQSPSQQPELITQRILANVGNLIVFKLTNIKDAQLLENYFQPDLSRRDFLSIARFNCYLNLLYNDPPLILDLTINNGY